MEGRCWLLVDTFWEGPGWEDSRVLEYMHLSDGNMGG